MQAAENNDDTHDLLAYQPRAVGDLLDQSLALLRRRFVHIFAISFLLQLGQYSIGLWTGEGATLSGQLLQLSQLGATSDISPGGTWASTVLSLMALLSSQIVAAAAAIFVAADLDGKKPDFSQVLSGLVQIFPRLLWTLVVLGALILAMVLGLGLMASFAIALGTSLGGGLLGGLVSLLVILLAFTVGTTALLYIALTPIVVVVEQRRGMAAIQRAAQLVIRRTSQGMRDSNLSRIAIIYTVVMLSTWGVIALFSLPAMGLQFLAPEVLPGANNPFVAQLVTILSQFLEVVGQAAIGPFGALAMAFFYFDLRARHEGLDLLLGLRRLTQPKHASTNQ